MAEVGHTRSNLDRKEIYQILEKIEGLQCSEIIIKSTAEI